MCGCSTVFVPTWSAPTRMAWQLLKCRWSSPLRNGRCGSARTGFGAQQTSAASDCIFSHGFGDLKWFDGAGSLNFSDAGFTLCPFWLGNGSCEDRAECKFAHGTLQLEGGDSHLPHSGSVGSGTTGYVPGQMEVVDISTGWLLSGATKNRRRNASKRSDGKLPLQRQQQQTRRTKE